MIQKGAYAVTAVWKENKLSAFVGYILWKRFVLYLTTATVLVSMLELFGVLGKMPIRLSPSETMVLWVVMGVQMSSLIWPGFWLVSMVSVWQYFVRQQQLLIWQSLGLPPSLFWNTVLRNALWSCVLLGVASSYVAPLALRYQSVSINDALKRVSVETKPGFFQALHLPKIRGVYYFPKLAKKTSSVLDGERFFMNVNPSSEEGGGSVTKAMQLWSNQASVDSDTLGAWLQVEEGGGAVFASEVPFFEMTFTSGKLPIPLPEAVWFQNTSYSAFAWDLWSEGTISAWVELTWRCSQMIAVLTLTLLTWAVCRAKGETRPVLSMLLVGGGYGALMMALVVMKSLNWSGLQAMLLTHSAVHIMVLLVASFLRFLLICWEK